MKNSGLLILAIFMFFCVACQKQETSAVNANSNVVNSTKNDNSNQKREQVSAPQGLKPPEPCAWFEKSLDLKAKEYKQSPSMPDLAYCVQVKPLANNSSFEYHAIGNAEFINKFFVYVRINERHSAKQKEDSLKMLSLTAMEIADRASGNKLTEEILEAILAGETKEFTIEPSADSTKPQLKTVSVENDKRTEGWSVRTVTLKF